MEATSEHRDAADVAIVGAGAAGLMAAIWAGRSARGRRVVALDGAARLGAKILVAGGGRCNVTHDVVEADAFAGSSRPAIRKVLRRFDVPATVGFFRELGVALRREPTGKLFPTTDRARTVLDALTGGARTAGAELRHPWRVEAVEPARGSGFVVTGPAGALFAARVVLATGGRSVPATGSDGRGLEIARRLGHTVTPLFPALVPLLLPAAHPLTALAGVSAEVVLSVERASGARVASFHGSLLCTHVGLSGPAVLDASRWWTAAREDDPAVRLVACWLPGETPETIDRWLRALGPRSPARQLHRRLPERLARTLCAAAGVDPGAAGHTLTREARRALAAALGAMPLPVTGDRGFRYAEATAGGVPLSELRLETLESRLVPGLHVCGEMCDVDGRIGGYNFQWAWASGYVAGVAAGRAAAVA